MAGNDWDEPGMCVENLVKRLYVPRNLSEVKCKYLQLEQERRNIST